VPILDAGMVFRKWKISLAATVQEQVRWAQAWRPAEQGQVPRPQEEMTMTTGRGRHDDWDKHLRSAMIFLRSVIIFLGHGAHVSGNGCNGCNRRRRLAHTGRRRGLGHDLLPLHSASSSFSLPRAVPASSLLLHAFGAGCLQCLFIKGH